MKRLILLLFAAGIVFGAAAIACADKGAKGLFSAKAGDTIYVCACGEACKCGTLGLKDGECGCGQKLVEAKVTKVEKGKVFYKVGDKEFSAPQQGKYMCGCGEGCNCGFVAQQKGNCGCGKQMRKVK